MRPDTLRPANRGDACRIQSGGVACQFVALRMATADEKGSDIDQIVRLQRGALVLPTIFSKSAYDNIPAHVLRQIAEELDHD